MPIIQITLLEGRSLEQKEALIRRMTEVCVDVLDSQPSAVRIIIQELQPENFGIAGESARAKRQRENTPPPQELEPEDSR